MQSQQSDIGQGANFAVQAIEAIGYGRFQVLICLLSTSAAYFTESFLVSSWKSAALEYFGLSTIEDLGRGVALLELADDWTYYVGMICGFLADSMGRRWVLVRSLGVAMVASWVFSLTLGYRSMLVANIFWQVASGAMFTSGIALASECAPDDYKMVNRGIGIDTLNLSGMIIGIFGAIGTPLFLLPLTDSPGLLASPTSPGLAALPAAVSNTILFPLLYLYLPESPVYLASVGRQKEAGEALHFIEKLSIGSEGYAGAMLPETTGSQERGTAWSVYERLRVVFLTQYCRTFWFLFVFFLLVKSDDNELFPSGPPTFVARLGVWEIATIAAIRFVGEVFSVANATMFSRSVALGNAMVLYFAPPFVWILADFFRPGNFVAEAIAQIATVFYLLKNRVVLTIGYQLAVESFPTPAAVTAGAFIIQGNHLHKYWGELETYLFGSYAMPVHELMVIVITVLSYSGLPLQSSKNAKPMPNEIYGTFQQEQKSV
mmetsp:Transcript_157749/g.278495  ORF Transcript_157749/g.278495 Transcript_157749/m.278495 type:complete len:489 (+) Transcript_157749:72-1538(+)